MKIAEIKRTTDHHELEPENLLSEQKVKQSLKLKKLFRGPKWDLSLGSKQNKLGPVLGRLVFGLLTILAFVAIVAIPFDL